VRRITEADDSAAVSTNIVVNDPAFTLVISTFVLGCASLLVERVVDAFFEDLIWIVWPRWTFWTRLRVRQAEVPEEPVEIIRMILNAKLFVQQLLAFQG
jgi:hypothetical protein